MTSIFTSRRRQGDTEIWRRRGKLPYWDRFTSYSRSSRAREHLTAEDFERAAGQHQTGATTRSWLPPGTSPPTTLSTRRRDYFLHDVRHGYKTGKLANECY